MREEDSGERREREERERTKLPSLPSSLRLSSTPRTKFQGLFAPRPHTGRMGEISSLISYFSQELQGTSLIANRETLEMTMYIECLDQGELSPVVK